MKTRHQDEWIDVPNVTERFDDQCFLGYQTLLTQNEKFQTKIRSGEIWLIYLDLMKVQHLARTPVQENDLNMRVLAWEKCCRFIFISTR